jgi:hypothetical protein
MRNITKLAFAGLAATIVFSFAVGSASARRFETSEQGFLARWSPLIFNAAGNRISCPVTLEGSFHSKTLSKVCGQLIGYVTRAQVPTGLEPPCQNGTATALTETLPWHILYVSFAGRLPSISSIRIKLIGAKFQVRAAGVTCLTATTNANPAFGDIQVGASGEANRLRALPEFGIPLRGEFVCGFAGNGSFEGTAEVFTLVTPQARITIRLVQ